MTFLSCRHATHGAGLGDKLTLLPSLPYIDLIQPEYDRSMVNLSIASYLAALSERCLSSHKGVRRISDVFPRLILLTLFFGA